MRPSIKVGVVGCGGISAFAHIPGLVKERDVSIVGLCDYSNKRARAIQERFSINCNIYNNIDDLLNEDIDALIIATFPSESTKLIGKALESKKHILLQKPLMFDRETMDKLLTNSMDEQQILALPYIESLHQIIEIKRLLDENLLGAINFSRIRTSIMGPDDYYADVKKFFGEDNSTKSSFLINSYAKGRGCLSDMGVYSLALYHYLFGAGVLTNAYMSDKCYEDTALLILKPCETNTNNSPQETVIESGWHQPNAIELLTILGTNGMVCLTTNGRLIVRLLNVPERRESPSKPTTLLPVSPYYAQREWLNSIRTQNKKNIFSETVKRSVWVSEVIDNAYSRAQSNETAVAI